MKNRFLLTLIAPFALTLSGCGNAQSTDSTVKFDYIFTAQPVVSVTESTIFKNVQDDFKAKSGGKSITQASIFVNNDADKDKVDALLLKVASDIEAGIVAPALIKNGIEQLESKAEQQSKFGVPGAIAAKVTTANNGFSLGFTYSYAIKEEISSFVNLLTNNGIGDIPDEKYYLPETTTLDPTVDYSSLKILAPTGAPSVAFYNFAKNANFETTGNPKQGLIPMFQTNNYDIIVAPTQGGLMQVIKQNANYKLAATITFGNFYLVATGHDDDGILNEGDKVLIFQETDVPGLVFKYTYGDLNLDITAVAGVDETKLAIENGGTLKE